MTPRKLEILDPHLIYPKFRLIVDTLGHIEIVILDIVAEELSCLGI